jgi:rod shape-determining protein MreC
VVAIVSFWDERKLFVFVSLIIIASIAMLVEINAARADQRTLSDEFVATVLTPVETAITQAASAIAFEFDDLAHAGQMASRNAALERKVQELAARNERLKERAAENLALRRMLGLAMTFHRAPLAADVVGYSPEGSRREIAIDRGWRDGVRPDAVVIAGDGVVGRVIDASAHDAHVLLIIDPTSSVPAFLRDARSWGIATGTWQHIRMKYIGQDVRVRAGDEVITGLGEVYPGGLVIGTVLEVDRKDSALYQSAIVQPAVDFDGLTHVLVLRKT